MNSKYIYFFVGDILAHKRKKIINFTIGDYKEGVKQGIYINLFSCKSRLIQACD